MNLEQLGALLPEDTKDLACWPFAKRYFSCQGTLTCIYTLVNISI